MIYGKCLPSIYKETSHKKNITRELRYLPEEKYLVLFFHDL